MQGDMRCNDKRVDPKLMWMHASTAQHSQQQTLVTEWSVEGSPSGSGLASRSLSESPTPSSQSLDLFLEHSPESPAPYSQGLDLFLDHFPGSPAPYTGSCAPLASLVMVQVSAGCRHTPRISVPASQAGLITRTDHDAEFRSRQVLRRR